MPQPEFHKDAHGWAEWMDGDLDGLEVVVEPEVGASRSDDCQVTQIN